jgi:hypothetical protein
VQNQEALVPGGRFTYSLLLNARAYLQCALTQMPKDPYAIVLHSSFLIDVQGSYQSGYTALQVRSMP